MAAQTTPATIKIAEESIHRVRSEPGGCSTGVPAIDGTAGGIYHTRSFSRVSLEGRSGRFSHDPNVRAAHLGHDVEEGDDWRDEHVKKKQVFRGTTLLWHVHFTSSFANYHGSGLKFELTDSPSGWRTSQ